MSDNNILFEGLRSLDLEDMVSALFEVDAYKSKMGEDRDVCVITFRVKDRNPAQDLMEFIEKGFEFVLDSDVSSGENEKGEYFVFVEIERSPKIIDHIEDLTYGVRKLTGIDDWKFKYYKENRVLSADRQSLQEIIPFTPSKYDAVVNQTRVREMKSFFNKTLMDDLTLDGDIITVHKPFNQKYKFKLVKEDVREKVVENLKGISKVDHQSMAEIFWMTKVLGDYNITKVSDKFILENAGKAIILQRT